MANIKEQLLVPESGWKRYDDTDNNIVYNGTGWRQSPGVAHYNNSCILTQTPGENYVLYVYTSRIRIISDYHYNMGIFTIDIDGNYTCNVDCYQTGEKYQQLMFEKADLEKSIHKVTATLKEKVHPGTNLLVLDAIDIDDDGFLLNETAYNYIRNLQPSSNETIVFNKVKKANLPNTTDNKFAIYFTDNGEIYINDKDGNVIPAINFKTEFLSNNDYKTLQDNNNIDHSKLYMVATDETLNNTKKMNLYYNNQLYSINGGSSESNKSYEVQQKVSLNVASNDKILIPTNDTENKIMIDNYKFIQGGETSTSILKEFNNGNKTNFIYNKDEIDFNNTSMSIKNEYKLSNTLNDDTNLYESDIINKSDFIEISGVE